MHSNPLTASTADYLINIDQLITFFIKTFYSFLSMSISTVTDSVGPQLINLFLSAIRKPRMVIRQTSLSM